MLKKIASTFAFLAFLALPVAVFAQTSGADLNTVGAQAGLGGGADLPTIIGRIIYVLLGLVGVILLGLLLYAGYTWMTSGGDPKKVEDAKTTIRNAVIGLIIIVSAYAITAFIINALGGAIGGGGVGGTNPFGSGVGFPSSAGSLGGGVIESHVPPRDATGI